MNYIKDQKDLDGKIVLLRLDLNVPIKNGKIIDETRINNILPIFKYLIEKNSKIIVISHIGRPKGKRVESLSLKPICENLKKKLNKKIKLISEDVFKLNIFSLMSFIFLFSFFFKFSQIGFKDRSSTHFPLGLPICEITIIFDFFSVKYLNIGKILSILVSSVILPFLIGTFKSSLNKTFFPPRSF